jgi:hypothetical protein
MEAINQAREIAEEILEMTKSFVITGDKSQQEEDVEVFLALLEDREPLIDELSDIRQQLDDDELASPEFAEVVKILNQVTELNKKHMEEMENMRQSVQGSYKEIKQGQRIHAGYNPLPGNEVSSKFDIKK